MMIGLRSVPWGRHRRIGPRSYAEYTKAGVCIGRAIRDPATRQWEAISICGLRSGKQINREWCFRVLYDTFRGGMYDLST